jgi:cysteine-rich repeat protein
VAAPQITHYTGDQLSVLGGGTISGAGFFIVDGDFSVPGTFDFADLVIVRGTTRIGSTDVEGNVSIYGLLWTHGFEFWRGAALVQYSSQGLGPAEAAGAGDVCVPVGCGDGLLQAGEGCDDGNLAGGDCCSPDCQYDPIGDACTDDVCDGAGSCEHSPNTAPCDTATPARPATRARTAPATASPSTAAIASRATRRPAARRRRSAAHRTVRRARASSSRRDQVGGACGSSGAAAASPSPTSATPRVPTATRSA